MSRTGFRLLDPVKSLRQRLDFVCQLHDREALLPRERQRRFLEAEGWVAWPGPGARRLHAPVHRPQPDVSGRLRDRGPARDARRHRRCPVLTFVGEVDEIAPAARGPRGRAAPRRAPRSTRSRCGPATSAWSSARPRSRRPGRRSPRGCAGAPARASCPSRGRAGQPDEIARARAPASATAIGLGLELAAGVGIGAARALAGAAIGPTGRPCASCSASEAAASSRLNRLGPDQPAAPGSPSACCSTSRPSSRPRTWLSSSRTAPTPRRRSSGGSTTSSAACSRSACARASTSAC